MEIRVLDKTATLSKGTAGLECHVGGQCATVSGLAAASGGIGEGKMVEPYSK